MKPDCQRNHDHDAHIFEPIFVTFTISRAGEVGKANYGRKIDQHCFSLFRPPRTGRDEATPFHRWRDLGLTQSNSQAGFVLTSLGNITEPGVQNGKYGFVFTVK